MPAFYFYKTVNNVIKTILFMLFFTLGVVAAALAMVADEVLYYYRQKIALQETIAANEYLRQLDEKNRSLLENIKQDPNILKRLAPITLGAEPNEPNAIIPKTGDAELQFAKDILEKMKRKNENRIQIPIWLERINHSRERTILFLAGCGLILVSLASFNLTTKKQQH